MKEFILKTVCHVLLLADKKVTFGDKIFYFFQTVATFGPIAFLMDGFNFWFINNKQFFSFVIICLVLNVFVGAWFHHKMNTFSWEKFFERNITMWVILVLVYAILEMLRLTAGDNIIGEAFGVLIQITTLLWPASKILKNAYFLSNKQFPPEFIMNRIYSFEKNGNLKELFEADNLKEK